MATVKVPPELLGEIIMLIVTKGVPAAIELLGRLDEKDITPAKVRALRTGLTAPERY